MSILFLLIPLGLVLVAIALWAFIWAADHDQFEDLDRAAHSILFDDDLPPKQERPPKREGTADRSDAADAASGNPDDRSA